MNIPNSITLARIALIPVFAVVYYLPVQWAHLAAAIIFTIAALTDLLDGYLARKLGQTSVLGEFLDPVADKLMVAVVLVALVQSDPSLWLALPSAIIICREITISALREWMAELGSRSKVAVSNLGKVKTTVQMISMIFLVLRESIGPLPIYQIGLLLLYIAAALTLWSMVQYLNAAWPEFKQQAP